MRVRSIDWILGIALPLALGWAAVPNDTLATTLVPSEVATAASLELSCEQLDNATTDTVSVPAGLYRPFFKSDSQIKGAAKQVPPPITVAAFRMDAHAVTRREFLRFVCKHREWRRSTVKSVFAEDGYLTDWSSDLDPGVTALEQPVTHVSWFAARAFCTARNARLPTTAEWERAGGGSDAVSKAQRGEMSAATGNPFRFAMGQPAADLRASALAFSGVWEWTADFNSVAAGGGRSSLFCGDGFRSNDARDYAAFLRYSLRSSLRGSYTLKNLGFRCVEEPRP